MPQTPSPPPSLMPHEEPLPPRYDLWTAAVFFCVGTAILWLCWQMPTYREQGEIYTAPGLVPALHGVIITVLSLWLGFRAIGRGALHAPREAAAPREGYSNTRLFLAAALCLVFAVGLVGQLPFWLAAAIFVFAFATLFEWQPGLAPRERARRMAIAAVTGLATGGIVVLVFERVFLVRLP
ncbi:tripartite tricarboxylate transporter TctB family protein [Vineibacter terrae]|uniref:tripartite tricarboxylate transporter TctB family protein n=1 Tax=Vineibacter terrae TaxID=2586908 RepID=UPI002E2F688E|nr:tripartite tricarboxylate transporter TctB family protein [Vineibacter terrae]HEX2890809.1 tripartite tricarboxylate transporter TctB family protein [Vineibacter terrae]